MSKRSKFKTLEELLPEKTVSWQEERDKEIEEKFKSQIHIKPVTDNHKKYLELIEKNQIILVEGVAGTGKTNYAAGMALKLLREGKIKKILVSRPMITCGKELGFFPGDMNEKTFPYMIPVIDAFEYYISKQEIDKYLAKEIIQIAPLELMRGKSINDSFVILDEAQNAEYSQLHMFITRLGQNSKFVIAGDVRQNDVGNISGFSKVIDRMKGATSTGHIKFEYADVLRNELIKEFDKRLDRLENEAYTNSRLILHTTKESWYQESCNKCQKTCWVNNGDERDSTLNDYDGFICWSCKAKNLINSNPKPYIGKSYVKPRI